MLSYFVNWLIAADMQILKYYDRNKKMKGKKEEKDENDKGLSKVFWNRYY